MGGLGWVHCSILVVHESTLKCAWSLLTGSEEGDGDGQNEAATAADADTLESIADIEEALEKLGQARNLIKAADTKVNFWPCFFEITSLQISPPLPSCPSCRFTSSQQSALMQRQLAQACTQDLVFCMGDKCCKPRRSILYCQAQLSSCYCNYLYDRPIPMPYQCLTRALPVPYP